MDWFDLEWFDASGYEVARQVLQRGIAALYLIAFLSSAAQFPALLGERGLLPVRDYLRTMHSRQAPTLFHWHYSDRMLRAVCASGAVISASLVAGLPQLGGPWLPLVAFLVVWYLYLSIVNVGQTFYGFGWESLLLEAGFVVAFLGSDQVAPPLLVLLFLRWLVFRLEFGAGLIKLRGGREWRDLTAMSYHHETQPMPNPFSRWAHLAPRWFHRLEVVGNHVVQLAVPFLLFFPQPIASIAAALIILTQAWLAVTGNFAWLNAVTIVLAFSAIDDATVSLLIPGEIGPVERADTPVAFTLIVVAVVAGLVVASWPSFRNLFARHQLMNASFNRWHLVNAYGAFGTVTRERFEVIVEGTESDDPRDEAAWRTYEFTGKPGDPRRIPPQVAPYHLRLDWLMWFLALGAPGDRWFSAFLRRLLEADRATLRLLRSDPFDGRRPTWVRARLELYRFATRAEHRQHGVVWMREPAGELVPPLRRRDDGG